MKTFQKAGTLLVLLFSLVVLVVSTKSAATKTLAHFTDVNCVVSAPDGEGTVVSMRATPTVCAEFGAKYVPCESDRIRTVVIDNGITMSMCILDVQQLRVKAY